MGEKLIATDDGQYFYSYVRTDGKTKKPYSENISLFDRRLSQLPFNENSYVSLCASEIPFIKGVPQKTEKCSPLYYPYIATKKDSDPLNQLIGKHNYGNGVLKDVNDYNNPFQFDLHPIFILLPPLKDVLIVRVTDRESKKGERNTFPGAYLTIKNGNIVEQLDLRCNINEEYYCVDESGVKLYKIEESGKFKKLTK